MASVIRRTNLARFPSQYLCEADTPFDFAQGRLAWPLWAKQSWVEQHLVPHFSPCFIAALAVEVTTIA